MSLSSTFVVLQPGLRWMVWAYHDTDDNIKNSTLWKQHTMEGHEEIDFLKKPKEEAKVLHYGTEGPTTGASIHYGTEGPTTGASTLAVSIIGHFLLLVIAVIFFY